jgi:hypothetical protein
LLDIRLSRLSLAVLAAVSLLATVVIITNGNGHTAAQLTALAALREPAPAPAAARTVTVAAQAPATTPSGSAASNDSGGSGGSGGSGSGSGDSSSASQAGGSSSDAGSSDSATGGGGNSGSDTSTSTTTSTTPATSPASSLPKVSHVFEIALSTTGYAAAFADKAHAPYLHSLEAKGTLLRRYESLGHGELVDYLASVSGQGPNSATSHGCTKYLEFRTGVVANAHGLVRGAGCVYPETALTIGDQVTAKGATWKAYVAGMGKQTCSHPGSGAVDDALLPGTASGYDTRHNPFIYFHSLLDLGDCASDDQDLTRLPSALAHKSATAKFSFIAPDACADAMASAASPSRNSAQSPTTTTTPSSTTTTTTTSTMTSTTTTAASTTTPTTTSVTSTTPTTPGAATTPAATGGCPTDQPIGIAAEDAFLKLWVPRVLASPAYKHDGVLIIAFAGERARDSGRAFRTGALVLSPRTAKGKVISTAYGPYSLLRSTEDMLGDTALAHAQTAPSFAKAIL